MRTFREIILPLFLCCLIASCDQNRLEVTDLRVTSIDYRVDDPLWNGYFLLPLNDRLVLFNAQPMGAEVGLKLLEVKDGELATIAEYRWSVSRITTKLLCMGVSAWDDDICVLIHDNHSDATILRFSLEGQVTVLWDGAASLSAEIVFVENKKCIALIERDSVTFFDEFGKTEEHTFDQQLSFPSVLGGDLILVAGEDVIAVPDGRIIRKRPAWGSERILLMEATNKSLFLLTARGLRRRQTLEVMQFKPNGVRSSRLRLQKGAWRIRGFGERAVLWDIDQGPLMLIEDRVGRRISWTRPDKTSVNVYTSEEAESVYVEYERGYSVIGLGDSRP